MKVAKKVILFILFSALVLAVLWGLLIYWYAETENSNFREIRKRSMVDCRNTLYHCAILNDSNETFESLIKQGHDLEVTNESGATALFWTIGGTEVKSKESPAYSMDKRKRKYYIDKLLSSGANTNTVNDLGTSALYLAVSMGDFSTVEKLISNGVNVNYLSSLPNGLFREKEDRIFETALHQSVKNNNYEMTKLLLENGANPNIAESDFNRTPLFISAYQKNLKITKLLLEFGANKKNKDKRGHTAYDFIKLYKDHSLEIADLLKH